MAEYIQNAFYLRSVTSKFNVYHKKREREKIILFLFYGNVTPEEYTQSVSLVGIYAELECFNFPIREDIYKPTVLREIYALILQEHLKVFKSKIKDNPSKAEFKRALKPI